MTDRSIQQVNIEREMREAYLSYAMSVIVARALPDARDGLKPVHRRILYAMHDMGIDAGSQHKKSARIVGEVLGKYHPHGDAAVYDTMVRMAQGFAMRYRLIDGQGNFGSIDGDGAAAMRYTEARMAHIGGQLLLDIAKETVDFAENFDGTLNEPTVLPAQAPNLLMNGASGIAVGMSTNIPPHNLGEICDALIYVLGEWERYEAISVDDLMRFVKGPDFPTGGLIYKMRGGEDTLRSAFNDGRGKITLRAKLHIEDMGRGKQRIIVSELPYQLNKTTLIERIAALASGGKLDGLADLRDESDRQNTVRLVIELQRNADVKAVLKSLYKLTPLQSTFGIIMLALVDGQPRMLNLKMALRVYLDHRLEVGRRRSRFDLARAQERAHVLEGLIIALDNLDAVIRTIRRSRRVDTARKNLIKNFAVTEAQATAILDMPLRRLAALEMRKIRDEHKEQLQLIKALQDLLASPVKQREAIAEELRQAQTEYGDARRSIIVDDEARFESVEDFLIPDEPTWVIFGANNRFCHTLKKRRPGSFNAVKRAPLYICESSTAQTLHLFTARGDCATVPAHQLPHSEDVAEGAHFSDISALAANEVVIAMHCLPARLDRGFLFFVTALGQVKRLAASELPGVMTHSFSVMKIAPDDQLVAALYTSGDDEVMLTTARGQAIRFREDEVRSTGLAARGMRGMKLSMGTDGVVAASRVMPLAYVWNISSDGIAKTTPMDQYKTQLRDGSGVLSMRLAGDHQRVAGAVVGWLDEVVLALTSGKRAQRLKLGDAEMTERRPDGGAPVVDLREDENVIAVVQFQNRIEASPAQRNLSEQKPPGKSNAPSASSDNGASIS